MSPSERGFDECMSQLPQTSSARYLTHTSLKYPLFVLYKTKFLIEKTNRIFHI